MKVPSTSKPIAFPLPFPRIPSYLLIANVTRETLCELIGAPMLCQQIEEDRTTDHWAFEYPCGLKVAFQFTHGSEEIVVLADAPEISHVLRHIPIANSDCERIGEEELKSELERLLLISPERQEEIDCLRSFQVWRQGTDGNPFRVGDPTSQRDAECWVNYFESLGHHQHYWYSKVDRKVP